MNGPDNREVVMPSVQVIPGGGNSLEVEVPPCGVFIVRFARAGQ